MEEKEISNKVYKYYYRSEKDNSVGLIFGKFSAIESLIIPFFDQFPILGQKSLDFEDFKKVSKLIKIKTHLTPDGFNKIVDIKKNMNLKRPW